MVILVPTLGIAFRGPFLGTPPASENVWCQNPFYFPILEKMTQLEPCLSADFCYRTALNLSFGSVLGDSAFLAVLDVAETCFSLLFSLTLPFCFGLYDEKSQPCFCIPLRRLH